MNTPAQRQKGEHMYDKLPLTPTQQSAVRQLVQKECCNYYHGTCLQTDRACAQRNKPFLFCDWFYKAVLPLDKELHQPLAALRGEAAAPAPIPDAKQCIICGRDFQPGSNSAKYCKACAITVTRENKRKYQRRKRLGQCGQIDSE